MSIWNKVLLGFIFIGFAGWLFLATKAMNVQNTWRPKVQQYEKDLDRERERKIALINGSGVAGQEPEMGLREAKLELYKLTVGRGRVWDNCVPQTITPKKHAQTGADTVDVLVNTVFPEPHGVELQTTLYIFEQANEQAPGRYLGQFVVTNLRATQLQIEPSLSPSIEEVQALNNSRQTGRLWSLHEIMPDDNHEIYAAWDSAEYMPLLPTASAAEYENEAERTLRDYGVLFSEMHRIRARNIDHIAALTDDNASLDSAVASARVQEQFRNQELVELKTRLSEIEGDRDAIEAHRLAVEKKAAQIETAITRSIERNQAVLAEVTRLQLEASRLIDARSRRMAQASPSR